MASVFVSGPGNLVITDQQADALSAEVLDGLNLLRGFAPDRDVIFTHHVMQKTVNVAQAPASTPTRLQPGNRLNVGPFEVGWRDAVFAGLDLPSGAAGVRAFTQQLRAQTGSDWAFLVFFTRYRLAHYAYAMNNRKISMGLSNEGFWGGNTDRVLAHETGHIFGAPDEYGSCICGDTHGPFDVPNVNCVNCAGGGTNCLMRSNAGILCRATSYHLGFNGLLQPPTGFGV